MELLYSTTAHATGDGRNGHVSSDDGVIDQDVLMPKELGGPGGATNPEQLFAAGYAACFHSALQGIARSRKITLTDSTVGARVHLLPTDAGGFQLAVDLALSSLACRECIQEHLVLNRLKSLRRGALGWPR